jgi:protein SCO1/2
MNRLRDVKSEIAVAAITAVMLLAAASQARASTPAGVHDLIGRPAPDFHLVDQSRKDFVLSGLRGRAVVLFFGYTHCPDICPTTLATIAGAMRRLGPDAPKKIQVAFVTDDPARDSPQTLGRFTSLFDPSFLGLSGSAAQMSPVYKAYHVWFQRLPNPGSAAGYLLAHSSIIYMIDRDGTLRFVHDWRDPMPAIQHDLKELMP